MEPDIIERIHRDFAGADAELVIGLLQESGYSGRLARCIIVAAEGNLEKVKPLIELSAFDYRDAIYAAEYDRAGSHVRDLTVSFLIDAPEHFWATEIARGMHDRGCQLAEIHSWPAPWNGNAFSKFEGVARFEGPVGPLTVELRNHAWMLRDNNRDLSIYGLDRAFEEGHEFGDTVSCYILTLITPRSNGGQ